LLGSLLGVIFGNLSLGPCPGKATAGWANLLLARLLLAGLGYCWLGFVGIIDGGHIWESFFGVRREIIRKQKIASGYIGWG
jgi:hypothetical protein